jgi:glycosyltransferase involved in cell wall biosynthesis
VILEAGNAGLPVVATAVGGIPEVIDDMKSGILIQSRNPGEIARAIAYLIDNPDRRAEIAQTLKTRIHDRFSVATMASQTLALYRREEKTK